MERLARDRRARSGGAIPRMARSKDEIVERVQERVWEGMGLIVLHSGHFSKIFKRLMGTPCALSWREAGEVERLWVLNTNHPIAAGLPPYFEIEHEEMYGEPFTVPEPLETLFISWFEGGEVFRSGLTYQRGAGRIFYFRPGHEAYPTYHNADVRRILGNAVNWAYNPAAGLDARQPGAEHTGRQGAGAARDQGPAPARGWRGGVQVSLGARTYRPLFYLLERFASKRGQDVRAPCITSGRDVRAPRTSDGQGPHPGARHRPHGRASCARLPGRSDHRGRRRRRHRRHAGARLLRRARHRAHRSAISTRRSPGASSTPPPMSRRTRRTTRRR